jgi:hypothetical protein
VSRELTAWDLVDEVLTEMTDTNYGYWSKDRLEFRNILIDEIRDYILQEDITVKPDQPERDGDEQWVL